MRPPTRLLLADLALAPLNVGAAERQPLAPFDDVRPGDWAWQALANLLDRHGCVAGLAAGGFQGGRAISRLEDAALLQPCLQRSWLSCAAGSTESKRGWANWRPAGSPLP
jgi:hypothetical protein